MSQVDNTQFVSLYATIHIYNTIELSVFALCLYDHILTFSGEVEHIWKREFCGVTVLFMLNRYAVMSGCIARLIELKLWRGFTHQHADQLCDIVWRWSVIATILMYFSIAGFSAIRTYAVFRRDIRVFAFILALGLVGPVFLIYYNTTLSYQAMPPPFTGCGQIDSLGGDADRRSFIFGTICTIIFEATALVLSWLKAVGTRSIFTSTKTLPYTTLIWRDGTIYSLNIVILTALGFMSIFDSASLQGFKNLPALTDTLLSICLSRFILHLRSVELSHAPNLPLTQTAFVHCETLFYDDSEAEGPPAGKDA